MLLWVCIILLYGCTQEKFEGKDLKIETRSASNIRTEENVINIVNVLLPQINPSHSRSSNQSISKITPVCSHSGRSASTDTLFYAVDLQEDGFVLVSAPLNVTPILGYAETGTFGNSESLQNENFQYFLEYAENFVKSNTDAYSASPNSIVITPAFEYDTLTIHLNSEPKCKVKWNQMWPENQYCPNKIAGCGPVAFAQIMSFLKAPSEISLSYPGHDVDAIQINWNGIGKHVQSSNEMEPTETFIQNHLNNCSTSAEDHATLGRLIREIGQRAFAIYRMYDTGTIIDNMYQFAQSLYPTKQLIFRETFTSLYEDLNNTTTIAYIRGRDNDRGGHAWVADGTMQIKTYVNYYESGTLKWSKDLHTDNYIHYNWGHGGNCNGYFLLGIFDTSKGTNITGPSISRNNEEGGNYENDVKYFTISK